MHGTRYIRQLCSARNDNKRNNMIVEIKDIKKNQIIYDEDERLKAYSDAFMEESGVWYCETTTSHEYCHILISGKHTVWDNEQCT